jgi:hypothetical protein
MIVRAMHQQVFCNPWELTNKQNKNATTETIWMFLRNGVF